MNILPSRYTNLADGEKRTTAYVILTLGLDVLRCQKSIEGLSSQGEAENSADYQFNARQLIRAIFAYIEAVTFSIKLSAVSKCIKDGIELSPPERYFAIDVSYELNEKGEVTARDAHIKLAQNIRFAISLYERAFGLASEFDPSVEWWSSLRQSIKVRDRITHPKLPRDVEISNDELLMAVKAKSGFETLIYKYLERAGQLPQSIRKRRNTNKQTSGKGSKYSRNKRKRWTKADVKELKHLARQEMPARLIAFRLLRTEGAVRVKAAHEGVRLDF